MFIIQLNFSSNKPQAGQFMQGHKEWLQSGFDEGIFLLSGSIKPNTGGCILASNTSHEELLARVNKDPFVIENIVQASIMEIDVSKAHHQLEFLLNANHTK